MKKAERKKELLKILTKKELKNLGSSYDVVGNIMILEFRDPNLMRKSKKIGEFIIKNYKHVKTVAVKSGIHSGVFRTRKLKIIAGKKTKKTVHRESGCRLMLDVEKVYFSPRLSTERLRIAKKVKKNEKVLVMFSGVAPFICVIAKHSKPKEIFGVEINHVAHEYAEKNIEINKLKNVKLLLGDVREIVPRLNKKFDRIVMPLPRDAETFLDVAFKVSKKGTIIHLYQFLKKHEIPETARKRIREACKKAGIKYRILDYRTCGQFSPSTYRTVFDFKVM